MPLPNNPSAPGAGNDLPNSIVDQMIENDNYLDSKINSQIQIGAGGWTPSVTNGASANSFETTTNALTISMLDFSNSGGKVYAEAGFVLPSDYDGGTITAKFHWLAQDASTNSVVWGCQGVAFADDDAIDTAYGTAQEVTDANLANGDVNISAATSAITIAGSPAAGEWAQIRIYRDSGNGSDDLAATASLLSVVLTYTRS